MNVSRLGVQGKLLGSAAITLVLLLVVGLVGIQGLSSVAEKADGSYTDATAPMIPLSTARAKANQQAALTFQHILETDPEDLKVIEAKLAENNKIIDGALAEVDPTLKTAAGRQAMAEIRSATKAFREIREPVLEASRRGDNKTATGQLSELAAGVDAVVAGFQKLQASKAQLAKTRVDEIHSTYGTQRTLSIVLIVLAVLLGLGISFFIARSIRQGVQRALDGFTALKDHDIAGLRGGIDALAKGNLTVEVAPATPEITKLSGDEIGDVGRAFNDIRSSTIASIEAYNTTRGELAELVGALERTATTLAGSSQQMATTSDEAGRAIAEIAQAIGEVAAGAERTVQQTGDARGLAEESAVASAQSAQEAADSSAAAARAREVAQQGVQAVEEASHAMGAVREGSAEATQAIRSLGEKSEEIGGIVATITAIAEQTNLLALNAAIEAARAGEQGRGFAVVAEEVRKLAEESQSAAGTIGQLIGAIQGETARAVDVVEAGARATESGVETVERARNAFVELTGSVEEIDEFAKSIAAAIQQIEAGAAQMQTNLGDVAAVAEQSSASTEEVSASTEQTTASTQEIAASAQELAGQAEELSRLVGRFQLA